MLSSNWTLELVDTENGKLVAFFRVLSDFTYRAFIYDVIVAKEYRGFRKVPEGTNMMRYA